MPVPGWLLGPLIGTLALFPLAMVASRHCAKAAYQSSQAKRQDDHSQREVREVASREVGKTLPQLIGHAKVEQFRDVSEWLVSCAADEGAKRLRPYLVQVGEHLRPLRPETQWQVLTTLRNEPWNGSLPQQIENRKSEALLYGHLEPVGRPLELVEQADTVVIDNIILERAEN